jgi:Bacterial archaeo-eukaryotic release factor family 3
MDFYRQDVSMFRRKDLDELVEWETPPAISLFLPTHIAGREIRQNPIRLRNLVTQAAARLRSEWRRAEVDDLFAPVVSLIGNREFWRHQEKSLSLFVAPGFGKVHRLPIEVPEEVVIGPRFHIKPLLPAFDDAGPFWLVTISAERTRLYRGSRWSFVEASGVDLPQGVGAIRGMTQYEETHYAAPTGRQPGGLPNAQPLGDAPDELRKTELIELLHRIARAVEACISADPAPLIVAAQPELRGHFCRIAASRALWPEGIGENPDAMRAEELHRRAYSLVAAKGEAERSEKLDRINALLGSGDPRATIRPTEIVKAACRSQVDALFIAGDEHLWGSFDEAADRIVAHGSAAPGDIDLLDYAATMTLRQGGQVTLVAPSSLPLHAIAAALLRY